MKKEGALLLTYIVCPFGYIKVCLLSQHTLKLEYYTYKTVIDKSHISKAWMVFALRTCGFGYAELEKSYCIMNMRRPMIVKIIQRLMP